MSNTFNKVNYGLRMYYGIQVVFLIIFSILSCIGGVYFLSRKEKYSETAHGEVIKVESCDKYVSNEKNGVKNYKQRCNIDYKFILNDKEYINSGVTTGKKYNVGTYVKIEYDPNNPTDNQVDDKFKMKYIGYGLFALSLLFIIMAISYYFVSKTKGAGAGMFAVEAIQGLTN